MPSVYLPSVYLGALPYTVPSTQRGGLTDRLSALFLVLSSGLEPESRSPTQNATVSEPLACRVRTTRIRCQTP